MAGVVGSFARAAMAAAWLTTLAAPLSRAGAQPNLLAQATAAPAAPAQAAQPAPSQPAPTTHASHRIHRRAATRPELVELMISHMRTKLQVTAAQRAPFDAVADVMRANAKTMEALLAARVHDADRSAVASVRWYEKLTAAHAAALQNFAPVFDQLYASLSASQREAADQMFSQLGERPFTPKSR